LDASTAAQPVAERHVLAERFKCKLCRNWVSTGVCPYEVRCMFAHGKHELRTMEMNLREGLITAEAIKSDQRVVRARERGSANHAVHVPAAYSLIPEVEAKYFMHNPYSFTESKVFCCYDNASDAESSEGCSDSTALHPSKMLAPEAAEEDTSAVMEP